MSAIPSLNQLDQIYINTIPDLINLKIGILDELFIKYNLTDITIIKFGINSNFFQVRFDEQTNTIYFTQDSIILEMQFNYQFYSMPPIYADRGSVNISIDEISYSMMLSISTTPLGKAKIQIDQFSLNFPPETLNFDFECISDLSYRIFEEIIFYKDFLA